MQYLFKTLKRFGINSVLFTFLCWGKTLRKSCSTSIVAKVSFYAIACKPMIAEHLTKTNSITKFNMEFESITCLYYHTGSDEVDILDLIHIIEGDEALQFSNRVLCEEFRHIFALTIPKEASTLASLNIIVDLHTWRVPRNRVQASLK